MDNQISSLISLNVVTLEKAVVTVHTSNLDMTHVWMEICRYSVTIGLILFDHNQLQKQCHRVSMYYFSGSEEDCAKNKTYQAMFSVL